MKTILTALLVLLMTAGCARIPVIDRHAPTPEFAPDEVVVYVRTGCPYSEQALELIMDEGFIPDIRNVSASVQFLEEMVAVSRDYFPDKPLIVPLIAYDGRFLRGFNEQSTLELLNRQPISNLEDYAYCE